MKKIIPILLFLSSCTEKTPTNISDKNDADTLKQISVKSKDTLNPVFTKWIDFYKKDNPDFSTESFSKIQEGKIKRTPTESVTAKDSAFNPVYRPFLIYSPDSSRYVDIDSYLWTTDKDGLVGFEADQKIVLVNVKENRPEQIGFFGPSFRIEDGFWKNKNELVLLGNSSDKVPFYNVYNFRTNKLDFYQSTDTIQFFTPYFDVRLQSHGIKTD